MHKAGAYHRLSRPVARSADRSPIDDRSILGAAFLTTVPQGIRREHLAAASGLRDDRAKCGYERTSSTSRYGRLSEPSDMIPRVHQVANAQEPREGVCRRSAR